MTEKIRLHEGLEELQRMRVQMFKRVLFDLLLLPLLMALVGFGAVCFTTLLTRAVAALIAQS